MAKRLLSLYNVPDDERAEVIELLEKHHIAHYETHPGFFGITPGGIWLAHTEDDDLAKQYLDNYQRERQVRARAQWQDQVQQGKVGGFWFSLKSNPLGMLSALVIIILALLMSLLPFMWLG